MSWTRLPSIKGRLMGCLYAGNAPETLNMHEILGVGFGTVEATRDDTVVFRGDDAFDPVPYRVADIEALAAADPDHDWRILFDGPLSDTLYQRHDAFCWVLVEQGRGFA